MGQFVQVNKTTWVEPDTIIQYVKSNGHVVHNPDYCVVYLIGQSSPIQVDNEYRDNLEELLGVESHAGNCQEDWQEVSSSGSSLGQSRQKQCWDARRREGTCEQVQGNGTGTCH